MLQCLQWYALQVRQRTEKLTAQLLDQKGYGPFFPTYVLRRWSDRVKISDQPLFPEDLFCKLDAPVRMPLLTTPGVVSIVGAANQPIPIPDSEIDAVRLQRSVAVEVDRQAVLPSTVARHLPELPLGAIEY
jgi:transcription antitermination factor NusG